MTRKIVLICTPLTFYSTKDEDAFFEWIKKIKCIKKFKGIGRELHLHIPSQNISEDDLTDLLALFYRYKKDMSQLQIFLNESNRDWFYGEPKGYWYKRVFGNS